MNPNSYETSDCSEDYDDDPFFQRISDADICKINAEYEENPENLDSLKRQDRIEFSMGPANEKSLIDYLEV